MAKLDRAGLAQRNRSMAEAFHRQPLKHQIRSWLLHGLATVPTRALRSQRKRETHERILLIRPDHLGDVLLTTPAITALRQANPEAEIHALVGPWSATMLSGYDELDLVITLPFPGFNRADNATPLSPYQIVVEKARQLRQVGYTSAVILRPDHWWGALLAKWAGIPKRIGYAVPDVEPFLTHTHPFEHRHVVEQNLTLVGHWTGELDPQHTPLRFPFKAADRDFVDSLLSSYGIAHDQPILVIHPGSGTEVKRWQDDNWARVADVLGEQLGATVVFSGGDHELALVRRIADAMQRRSVIVVGETQISQLAALFHRAVIVLGPDSGPLHLAVAVGTPTVTLFGPADPVEFAPWGTTNHHAVLTSDIECRPCRVLDWSGDDLGYHPCVRDITIAQVLDAARRVLH